MTRTPSVLVKSEKDQDIIVSIELTTKMLEHLLRVLLILTTMDRDMMAEDSPSLTTRTQSAQERLVKDQATTVLTELMERMQVELMSTCQDPKFLLRVLLTQTTTDRDMITEV
jgi:hypothetical protein